MINITFCGEIITQHELELIQKVTKEYSSLSRTEIASTLCELLDWIRPNGHLKTRECTDLLTRLEEKHILRLPSLRAGRPKGSATKIYTTGQGEKDEIIEGKLNQIQPIVLTQVINKDEGQLWRELVERYHYLGYKTPFGGRIQYLIKSRDKIKLLGCIQFSSPARRIKKRDQWIGWDDSTRKKNLQHIICNSRFLILPWVRIPNLASHILAKAVFSVKNDWERIYSIKPYLVETLVDIRYYSGSCYRAANWIDTGLTSGRGRNDKNHTKHGKSPKRIFLYPIIGKVNINLKEIKKI